MIKPIGPRVLVKKLPDEDERTNAGLFIITLAEQQTSVRGEVLATGDPLMLPNGDYDSRYVPIPGDIIRYHKAVATTVPDGYIVDVINILGVE